MHQGGFLQTTIKHVLGSRPSQAWTVAPSTLVREAVELMADNRLEALLVLEDRKLVGILTERDCARRVWLPGKDPRTVRVAEVMTTPVVFVSERHCVRDCMNILSERGFAHLPVLDGDRVVDLVSIEDLVGSIVAEQGRTINHLEEYITGRYRSS